MGGPATTPGGISRPGRSDPIKIEAWVRFAEAEGRRDSWDPCEASYTHYLIQASTDLGGWYWYHLHFIEGGKETQTPRSSFQVSQL